MSDLERAFKALMAKQPRYNQLFQYRDGQQPLVYSTNRLRETFENISARFQQNWMSVVIDASLDRLVLQGFNCVDEPRQKLLEDLWNFNQLAIEAVSVHEAALITHEAFIIAWKDEAGKVEAYYNDPRLVEMFYSLNNPRRKEFAAKWYVDREFYYHMILYYPDRLEYYKTAAPHKQGPPNSYTAFVPDVETVGGGADNEYGVIPVFHFRTNPRSHLGELDNLLTLQDAVNKLLADMMVAAEFGAFRQRWVISQGETSALRNAPNEIWTIQAGDGVGQQSQVGEFAATDLSNYLNSIDKIAQSIAIISRTPKHYFYSTGASLSGEALLAMEAPLAKKIQKFEVALSVVWQELAVFLLLLSGEGEVDPVTILPIWEPIPSIQPLTEAQTRKLSIDSGIPLVTQLRREGWSEAELVQLEDDMQEEKKASQALGSAMLQQIRANQEQANASTLTPNAPTNVPQPNGVVNA